MKFATTAVTRTNEILYNDHKVTITYDCSAIAANEKGIIPAGTMIPANDATAIGVLLNDVVKAENPNGAVVVHGWIKKSKMPAAPASAAIAKLPMIVFMDE